ncbi:MAG: hypothetical protein Q9182_002034 [Xanthomendoza sp. 2 TL-2023]
MTIIEPWQSWLLFGAAAGGAYLYYSRTDSKRRGRGGTLQTHNATKRRTSRPRTSSVEASSSNSNSGRQSQSKPIGDPEASSTAIKSNNNSKAKNRRGGNAKSSQLAQSSAVDVATPYQVDANSQGAQEEEADNREFAKQMSGLKTGSSIAKNAGSKTETKRQSKQAELPLNSFNALAPKVSGMSSSKNLSNASSTTGADADDDLSSSTSPTFGATQATTSGDVSDMLEAPTKGHSVLRLTGVEEPKRQPKPQKVTQEPETKKQRQNRRKKEEQKLARGEAERDRRVLLEKQLRTSREAEGRPAKNGMGSAPATNAWKKRETKDVMSAEAPSSVLNGDLLDTFDENATPSVNGHEHQRPNGGATEKKAWQSEVPSEEEQMRILTEMEGSGGWSTVKGGKRQKPVAIQVKENEREASTASLSLSGTDEQSASTSDDGLNQTSPSEPKPKDDSSRGPARKKAEVDRNIWNFDNIKDHPDYEPDYPHALLGHPGDSDWAVV